MPFVFYMSYSLPPSFCLAYFSVVKCFSLPFVYILEFFVAIMGITFNILKSQKSTLNLH